MRKWFKGFIIVTVGITLIGVQLILPANKGIASGATKALSAYQPNDHFSIPELKNEPNLVVLDCKSTDVTGDKIPDTVILVGQKEPQPYNLYAQAVKLVVQDSQTGKTIITSAGDYGGYDSELFTGDFNGDQIADVMVKMASGGSGGTLFASLFSFAGGKVTTLFSQTQSDGPAFEGVFTDNFKASVVCKNLNKPFTVDLSANKQTYLQSKVYTAKGKLLSQETISVDGYSLLDPVDWNGDGTYELKGTQAMWGICHADTIAEIETILAYQNGKWQIKQLQYTTFLLHYE